MEYSYAWKAQGYWKTIVNGRYRYAVFLKVFFCIKFDEAKIRELWTDLQEKKCFKGFKTLGRQSKVITNRG